jgi:hypothetical protein
MLFKKCKAKHYNKIKKLKEYISGHFSAGTFAAPHKTYLKNLLFDPFQIKE